MEQMVKFLCGEIETKVNAAAPSHRLMFTGDGGDFNFYVYKKDALESIFWFHCEFSQRDVRYYPFGCERPSCIASYADGASMRAFLSTLFRDIKIAKENFGKPVTAPAEPEKIEGIPLPFKLEIGNA